jgi:selT/selW/selH-like putative selenoprotein
LAAEIRQAVGVGPELIKGANGIFDVTSDGALIFSKHRDGGFPGAQEIIEAIRRSSPPKP